MTNNQFLKIRIGFTLIVTIALGSILLFQYLNNGIPSHHFLARNDLPLVSNAWGILTVPVFTWFLLWRISKRFLNAVNTSEFIKNTTIAFVASLVFGVALGLGVLYRVNEFTSNVPLILFALALFFPTYRAEYFLGFVLGLTYFIGGVLPIVAGAVFLLFSAIVHLYVRRFLLWIYRLIFNKSTA
jgi:hypothetical protein